MTKGKQIKQLIQEGKDNTYILSKVDTTLNSIRWYRSQMKSDKIINKVLKHKFDQGTVPLILKIKEVRDKFWKPFLEEFGVLPETRFDLKGGTAGQVRYTTKFFLSSNMRMTKAICLRFNLQLAKDNLTDFLARTVPHELAHILANARNMKTTRKVPPHGLEWRKACKDLGMAIHRITRCHDYEVPKTSRKSVPTECEYCHKKMYVSPAKAERMRQDKYYHTNCMGFFEVLD